MTECCGKPLTGAEGRLVNWEERNYKVTDQPNPRGEIILGGDSIAKVNFKQTLFDQRLIHKKYRR